MSAEFDPDALTPAERRARVEPFLLRYQLTTGSDDETVVRDVIADLLHVADSLDLDVENELNMARYHYLAEQEAERRRPAAVDVPEPEPAPAGVIVVMRPMDSSNEVVTFGLPDSVRVVDVDYGRSDLRDADEFAEWADDHRTTAAELRGAFPAAADFLLELVEDERSSHDHPEVPPDGE